MSLGSDMTVASPLEEVFTSAHIEPSSRKGWYRKLARLDRQELAAVYYLMDNCHYPLAAAFEGWEDVQLQEGPLDDVAQQLFDECYLHQIPQSVQSYIDYEQFAYDCRISGDLREFRFAGMTYTCTSGH